MRTLVAALAAVVVLGGCSDDPTPQFEPTPSQSPTETPSAAEPEPWEEKTDEGAIAFVEHWVDEFSTAFQTGQTTSVQALAEPECVACAGLTQLIADAYAGGGSIEGDAWEVLEATVDESSGRTISIRSLILQPAQVVRAADGPSIKTDTGEVDYLFDLFWDDGWLISDLRVER